jgi:hypothetical protein
VEVGSKVRLFGLAVMFLGSEQVLDSHMLSLWAAERFAAVVQNTAVGVVEAKRTADEQAERSAVELEVQSTVAVYAVVENIAEGQE